MMFYG